MSLEADKLVQEALRLSPEKRAEMIEALVRSLDDGDNLDDEDRGRLHEALRRSEAQFAAGLGVTAAELLERLDKR